MSNMKKILIFSGITLILIIAVVGVTYAWFSTTASTEGNITVDSGTLRINYTQGNIIDASNLKPATKEQVLTAYNNGTCKYDNEVYTEQICYANTFIVTNTGTLASIVTAKLSDIVNEYSDYLKYQVFEIAPSSLIGTTLGKNETLTDLANNTIIPAREDNTKTYTILIWLDENATNIDQDKTYTATIRVAGVQTNVDYVAFDGFIFDGNDTPIVNADLEMHSIPRYTKTDENGYFNFGYVETGNHTIIAKDVNNIEIMNDTFEIKMGPRNMATEKTVVSRGKVKVNILGDNNTKIEEITLVQSNLKNTILDENTAYPDNKISGQVTNSSGIDFKGASGTSYFKQVITPAQRVERKIGSTLGSGLTFDQYTGKYSVRSYYVPKYSGQTLLPKPGDTICSNGLIWNCDTMYKTVSTNSVYISVADVYTSVKDNDKINGEGLYYTINDAITNDINVDGKGETVYYFRGDIENNYVIFANLCFRIVRINEDGSVKLRYGGIPSNNICLKTGENVGINDNELVIYSKALADNRDAFYMYGDTCDISTNCQNNKNDSTAKEKIDIWYENNILNKGASVTNKIADTIYCNDRSIYSGTGIGSVSTVYNGNIRIFTNKTATLKCENKNDMFTVTNELGNTSLKYPVALLTADELVYAGSGMNNQINKEYFLYTPTSSWTMTPHTGKASSTQISMNTDGRNTASNALTGKAVLIPVISLNDHALVNTGSGYYNDPYIVG